MAEGNGKEDKRLRWFKMPEGWHRQTLHKLMIRKKNGPTMHLVYELMICESLKNNGEIYCQNKKAFDTLEAELAFCLDWGEEDVKATLDFLKANDMAEITDDKIVLKEITENDDIKKFIGSETKQAGANRKRRANSEETPQSNGNLTQNNVGDKGKDKGAGKDSENNMCIDREGQQISFQEIINLYRSICKSCQTVINPSPQMRVAAQEALKYYTISEMKKMFQMAEQSPYIKSYKDKNSRDHTFTYVMKHFDEVLNGERADWEKSSPKPKNKFDTDNKSDYGDIDELEKKLLSN